MVVHTVIVGYHERIAVDIYRKTFDFIEDKTAMSLEVGKKVAQLVFLDDRQRAPKRRRDKLCADYERKLLDLGGLPNLIVPLNDDKAIGNRRDL